MSAAYHGTSPLFALCPSLFSQKFPFLLSLPIFGRSREIKAWLSCRSFPWSLSKLLVAPSPKAFFHLRIWCGFLSCPAPSVFIVLEAGPRFNNLSKSRKPPRNSEEEQLQKYVRLLITPSRHGSYGSYLSTLVEVTISGQILFIVEFQKPLPYASCNFVKFIVISCNVFHRASPGEPCSHLLVESLILGESGFVVRQGDDIRSAAQLPQAGPGNTLGRLIPGVFNPRMAGGILYRIFPHGQDKPFIQSRLYLVMEIDLGVELLYFGGNNF